VAVEVFFGYGSQWGKPINARVVHENVEFPVGFLCLREQAGDIRLLGDVALHLL
jgi:hypothetical protein